MQTPATTSTAPLASTARERGLLAATFYLAGGLTSLLASLAPHAHTLLLAVLSLMGLAVAGVSYLLHRRFVYWATLASSMAGQTLIAVGILAGNGSWASAIVATLSTFVAVHTALVLRWQHAGIIQLWGAVTAVAASWHVAPELPLTVVAASYLLICGTLWGVTTRLVGLVRRQAATDPLTGLANRAAFSDALGQALATVQRTEEPLSLIALDLDEFKLINDTHGHGAGDTILIAAAHAWSGQARGRDTLARTGGDEFVAILPGADANEAARIARRLQDATPAIASCSIGVATWTFDQTAEQLVKAADRALYRDKARTPTESRAPEGRGADDREPNARRCRPTAPVPEC